MRWNFELGFILLCMSVVFSTAPETATAAIPADYPQLEGRRSGFTYLSPTLNAPVTPMHRPNGGVTNLSRYRGQVVLLNLWATWCAACLRELPKLDRLQSTMAPKGLAVVPVSLDDSGPETIKYYFERLGIQSLPILSDPSKRAAKAFEIHSGLPWTFLIDRNGIVVGYMKGAADWDTPDAARFLDYFLKRKH